MPDIGKTATNNSMHTGLMPKPYTVNERTNNRLIRGPKVDVPATVGLETDPLVTTQVDKSIVHKWTEDHNTASQGLVTIPKGHCIAFNDAGLVCFADADGAGAGYGRSKNIIGLNYLNQFKPVKDRLAANRPTTAVRGYFELPVFAYDNRNDDHRWGCILANATDSIKPGDVLRLCGSTKDASGGSKPQGWLTNCDFTTPANLLDIYDPRVVAQVLEFDDGPTFDGLEEWVQFDNPYEFEFGESEWLNGDDSRYVYRDPDSPTGFSFEPYPYDPRLGDPYWRDAQGIPNLSDGNNWATVKSGKVAIPTEAGATTYQVTLYYFSFGGVGNLVKWTDESTWSDVIGDVRANIMGPDGSGGYQPLHGNSYGGRAVTIDSVDSHAVGALTFTIGVAAGAEFTLDFFGKGTGQVAGIPVMIDIKKCIGIARFQFQLR